jgi:hypothetical protein
MKFAGTWHFYEMELWDEDYFNMDVQAYIKINSQGYGRFQFGLVSGEISGEVVQYGAGERFDFTWGGNDECDPASGRGWLELKDRDGLKGKVKFQRGDNSKLRARRVK